MTREIRRCAYCDEPLPPPRRPAGRQRAYCDDRCRSAANRLGLSGPEEPAADVDRKLAAVEAARKRLQRWGAR